MAACVFRFAISQDRVTGKKERGREKVGFSSVNSPLSVRIIFWETPGRHPFVSLWPELVKSPLQDQWLTKMKSTVMDHDSSRTLGNHPVSKCSFPRLSLSHSLLLSMSWPHSLLSKMNLAFWIVGKAKGVDERETWPQAVQAPQRIPQPHKAPDYPKEKNFL